MKYKNGLIYEGEFKLNTKKGKGIQNLDLINKDIKILFNLNLRNLVYIGEFINDKIEGKRILFINNDKFFNENIIYEGVFKNNKNDGKINLYFLNGNKLKTLMKEDSFNNTKEIEELKNFIKKEESKFYGNQEKIFPYVSDIK